MNWFKLINLLFLRNIRLYAIEGEGGGVPPDPGQSGNLSPEPPPAANDPNFNPQDFSYKFRDEMVTPKSREDMIELMQMGHSYRYNKPRWDELKQSLDQRAQTYETYQKLHESLEANPAFKDELMEMYNRHTGQQTQQPQGDPRVDEVVQKVHTWEERQADADLQREVQEVMSKYPHVNWTKDLGEGTPKQQLLNFMAEHGINNPEFAYRAMYFPKATQNAAHQAAAQTTQNIQQQHKAGIVQRGTTTPPGGKLTRDDLAKQSWDSLADMALADLKGRQ